MTEYVRHQAFGGLSAHPVGEDCPICEELAEEAVHAGCTHEGTGRVRKFDGGKLPILCEACYTIVGWDR